MPTGPKKGLNPAKLRGNGPNNKGIQEYPVASGYATALYTGDAVKLNAGHIEKAATGDVTVGVLQGVEYTDQHGVRQYAAYLPASTTGDIRARVVDDVNASFFGVANGTIDEVRVGNLYAMDVIAGNAAFGRSHSLIRVLAQAVGDEDITAEDTLVELSDVSNGNTFTVRSSLMGVGEAVTITIETADVVQDLLDDLNAVPNIHAEVIAGGLLKIQATDGGNLILTNGSGTPLVGLGITAGTFNAVATTEAMVRVLSIVDPVNRVLEVTLDKHLYAGPSD